MVDVVVEIKSSRAEIKGDHTRIDKNPPKFCVQEKIVTMEVLRTKFSCRRKIGEKRVGPNVLREEKA